MKHSLFTAAVLSLSLAACVDTTGLSSQSSSTPHPQTSPNSAVVVAEYADLQCPACKAAHDQVMKPIIANYGTQISYEFHHFPLTSIHRYAMEAAEAAECAADQGKFWEFVDASFVNQETMSSDAIGQWGQQLSLDADLFERCRASHIKRDLIQASYNEGVGMGVSGTPTFFVNGQRVESSPAAIGAAIDAALGNAGANL